MPGLQLKKPLAVLDLEATGTSPRADRIVEIAIVRLAPDGNRETRTLRLNPGIPIPPETTDIHGITDADVADCPTFADKAEEIAAFLDGCDVAGYNILRYDLPMLTEEFARADMKFDIDTRDVVDVQRIFHRREPRDLTAALAFYCGEMHLDAHGAEADALATIRVLEGELRRYPDLPRDVAELGDYCNPRDPSWADRTGRLKWANNEIVLNFGRRKGETLRGIIEKEGNFIKWMLRSDFPRDTREIVQNALEGKWPAPP